MSEKGSFLAPGLFSLPGGSSGDRAGKKADKGDRETWKKGPRGRLIVLFSVPQGRPGTEGPLAAVQGGDEEDAVLVLKLVVQLTLVQERNEDKTLRATFPVCPQVSRGVGVGGEGWAALGENDRIYQKTGFPILSFANAQDGGERTTSPSHPFLPHSRWET